MIKDKPEIEKMDFTAVPTVNTAHQSHSVRTRQRQLKEFAELSPTEKCIVLLNLTALLSAILNFLIRLTMTVLADKKATSNSPEKASHPKPVVNKITSFKNSVLNFSSSFSFNRSFLVAISLNWWSSTLSPWRASFPYSQNN